MTPTSPWRARLWLLPILTAVVVFSIYIFSPYLNERDNDFASCNNFKFRESIAKELGEVQQQMQKLLLHKQAPSVRLIHKMREIVKRLDGRLAVESITNQTISNSGSLDVCPEVYKGTKFGYPFYNQGWEIVNCSNAKPLHSVVSVLVNAVAYPKQDEGNIETVLKGITETYPTVQVYLATHSNEVTESAKKYKNVDVVKIDEAKVAKGWNTLASNASTPYVLVARDLFHFTWLTQLERQIRVVSQIPNVGVAGGSYRNFSGHWKAGCVQTTFKNYVLKYQEGYFHSRNGCMFCDYLLGPFVAKTSLLKLDESLPNEVVFEDWFLSIVENDKLVMSCPDAMYFTSDYWSYTKRIDRNVWTPLAKKWGLNRVLLPEGYKHSFSCKDIGASCKAMHELLPICCLEEYADVLSFFQNFTNAHNGTFELDSGSVLGGVKFKGLVPWDIDGDSVLLSTDINLFGEKETVDYFQKNGYRLSSYQPYKPGSGAGYVSVDFNEFNIEVWGMGAVSNTRYLPKELQKLETFTKANIRGYWINTAFSPALYARNRYGREILKHSQSWRKVGFKDSWVEYKPGSFEPCKNPKHHACINDFPSDGDIPFLIT